MDHNKLWKILREMGTQTALPASWETCIQVKKQQLKPDMEQKTSSKLGKEYIGIQGIQGCILSSCLFNFYAEYIMQNVGLLKHKLESR